VNNSRNFFSEQSCTCGKLAEVSQQPENVNPCYLRHLVFVVTVFQKINILESLQLALSLFFGEMRVLVLEKNNQFAQNIFFLENKIFTDEGGPVIRVSHWHEIANEIC
jgi:hypothetical protein